MEPISALSIHASPHLAIRREHSTDLHGGAFSKTLLYLLSSSGRSADAFRRCRSPSS